MREEGLLSIGDQENIIAILGAVYSDPRDAVAEFITNSSDANATKIYVFLYKRAKEPHIRISDDGDGIPKDVLKYVAENVGKSLKRYDPKSVGEKGIGILGFQAIADRCDIVSKGNAAPESFCLSLASGTRNYSIEQEKERALQIRGTDVYLYSIGDDKWRLFTRDKLANYFKSKFRLDLLSNAYSLEIVEGKEATLVRPEAYKGEPFYIDFIRTNYGNIHLSLYILPTGRSCSIDVYCKNKKVINLAELPEFACEPWNLGKVQGEITADFLTPNTTRAGFIRDRKHFPAWVNGVKSIEKQLASEIERLSKEYNTAQTRKLYKKLKLAFQKAIAELNLEGMRRRKTSQKLVPVTSSRNGGPSKKSTKGGKKRERRRMKAFTFSWNEEPFTDQPELRSRLDPKLAIININKIHPDYKKECQSAEGKDAYFRMLTSKELALYNYPKANPEALLEEFVAIEVCVRRHL